MAHHRSIMASRVNGKHGLIISGVIAGARAGEGAVVEDGNKLKVRLEAHQTIKHLKGMIIKATKGLKRPFELQKHGAKTPFVLNNGKTLGECGLVSGSVLCVPPLDIHFVLPGGPCCDFLGNRRPIVNFITEMLLGNDTPSLDNDKLCEWQTWTYYFWCDRRCSRSQGCCGSGRQQVDGACRGSPDHWALERTDCESNERPEASVRVTNTRCKNCCVCF